MEQSAQILKQFQLTTDSISQKSDEAYGLKICQYINSTISAGNGSYYFQRNARFKKNRNAANGRINVYAMFSDLLQMNGKTNYANINWKSIHIYNRIISGLVGRWMNRNERIVVKATDSLSEKEKQKEYENIEYIVHNREILEDLQEKSGIQMIPDKNLPIDKEELFLWQSQFLRLPEEILYEMGTNSVLEANGFYDVNKSKALHDSAEVGFVGTYTWMDDEGVIHVELVKPENAIYSYSDYPDFRDSAWLGRVISMKISEVREKYGQEFGGKLSEEQIWELASSSNDYQLNDKLTWNVTWSTAFLRPYDEWNIDLVEFDLRSLDSEKYTITNTKLSGSTYIEKGDPKTSSGKKRDKPLENQKIIEDKNWNIYRGVYARNNGIVLEWGIRKNMIAPQDPKDIGNAKSSYSFYMPQNYEMRNLAIPEKIEVAVEGMILIELKIQQLIARMRPTGAAINIDALNNVDYGLGDKNKSVDYKKLYDQAGDIYYRGKDADGNPIPIPIQELSNSGFLPQMQGLMQLYQFHYQRIKDELGEDPNLMSQALQPRVTEGNVNVAQQTADNATDYFYDAYKYVIEMTSYKIACLMQKSVLFGAKAYRDLIKEEDVKGRIFNTKIKLLPNDIEIAKFEAFMNQAIAANGDLILFIDPFQLSRIAREDVKLAEVLFRQGQKKMLMHQMEVSKQNAEMNANVQTQSLEKKGQIDIAIMQMEADNKEREIKLQGEAQNKTAIINMVSSLLSKGIPISPEVKPLLDVVMQNLMLPLTIQNEEQKNDIIQRMQQVKQVGSEEGEQQQNATELEQDQQEGLNQTNTMQQ